MSLSHQSAHRLLTLNFLSTATICLTVCAHYGRIPTSVEQLFLRKEDEFCLIYQNNLNASELPLLYILFQGTLEPLQTSSAFWTENLRSCLLCKKDSKYLWEEPLVNLIFVNSLPPRLLHADEPLGFHYPPRPILPQMIESRTSCDYSPLRLPQSSSHRGHPDGRSNTTMFKRSARRLYSLTQ